jgi:hypothetical protein
MVGLGACRAGFRFVFDLDIPTVSVDTTLQGHYFAFRY